MHTRSAPQWLTVVGLAAVAAITMAACEGVTQSGVTATASGNTGVPVNGGTKTMPVMPGKEAQGGGVTGAMAPSTAPGYAGMDARYAASIISPNGSGQQYGIWVNGMGTVVAKPDVGILSFGVEARGDTVALARTRAAEAMTAALKALKDNRVADKDIQTQGFSIHPIFNYNNTRDGSSVPIIAGYQVTNTATAKLRNLEEAGTVIDSVAKAGGDAIRIHNIAFTIDDPKPLEAQARELALKDAMAKGRQIAQVTGVTLGAPILITESGGSPVIYQKEYARGAPAMAADAATPIQTGESQVSLYVQVVFAIQ